MSFHVHMKMTHQGVKFERIDGPVEDCESEYCKERVEEMKSKFAGLVILNGKKMKARNLNASEAAVLKKTLGGEKAMIEAVKYRDIFVIGDASSANGMTFGEMPTDIVLGIMISKGCGWLTQSITDRAHAEEIIKSLGGRSTFVAAHRFGSMYSARYAEPSTPGLLGDDSGTWDMGCLGPGL